MDETIRIRTDINPTETGEDYKYININLKQKFDFLEILSLKISQEDVYRTFCADYGVVVGRIVVNGGFGLPNAKISIFIPKEDINITDYVKDGLYPYQSILDKNDKGVRYNLLPKKRQNACHYPVGSYPNKREFLDNDVLLEIYEEYYKFTTTTNKAGDYMLFGIPTGDHTMHIDVDISDIGTATRKPYDMMRDGSAPRLFESPTKYKNDRDLDQLRQIIKSDTNINVLPFWGEKNCDVGINRVDYNLPLHIETSSMFFGSVITDKDKHSVNRHCRARKKAGNVCEMTTGQGQIEMIRKSQSGVIEYKLIDGGRVIDDDGTWAYQIPMNLKPMITDEFGNLIPSEDPRKGLMSEADVRFRVSMDISGGEGRIRETAKYLVPHNPNNVSEVDYNFGDNTRDDSFFKMRWNKIYTVRNFIPRYQSNKLWGADNRHFTGLKEVDKCPEKSPFPYNRIDTDIDPLFSIIMLLLRIVGLIVVMLNAFLIPILNLILVLVNWIIGIINAIIVKIQGWICNFTTAFNDVLPSWLDFLRITEPTFCDTDSDPPLSDISPIPCLSMDCKGAESSGSDCEGNPSETLWAPGCECCHHCGGFGEHCNDGNCNTAGNENCALNIVDDGNGGSHPVFNSSSGPGAIIADLDMYLACVGAVLAEKFEMYNLDFYNDWVNGVLYHVLYKNKRKSSHNNFCNVDYDCSNDILGGLFCMKSYVTEVLTSPGFDSNHGNSEKMFESRVVSSGLIKKYDDVMYYAPFASGHKYFATDITVLGSINDCDVDGFPYIIDRIEPTSYKKGPLFDTVEISCPGGAEIMTVVESGIIGFDDGPGILMNVTWLGLWVNYCQSRNVRLQCEVGRNTDVLELPDIDNPNTVIGMLDGWDTYDHDYSTTPEHAAPCNLTSAPPIKLEDANGNGPETQDIYDEFVRYTLRGMNTPDAITNTVFDTVVAGQMYLPGSSYDAHTQFRGFSGNFFGAGDGEFGWNQTDYQPIVPGLAHHNSYHFYFGLVPAKTAMDKLKTRYLTGCDYQDENDFMLSGYTVDINVITPTPTGELHVIILGGQAPYEYLILLNGDDFDHEVNYMYDEINLITLDSGVYTVIVNDATGGSSRAIFEITQPDPLSVGFTKTDPLQSETGTGSISIDSLNGGDISLVYTYELWDLADTTLYGSGGMMIDEIPELVADGLYAGEYVLTITNGGSSTSVNIILIDPPPFTAYIDYTDIPCHGGVGQIIISNMSGGSQPITTLVTGTATGYESSLAQCSNLLGDSYTVAIVDASNYPPSKIILQGVEMIPTPITVSIDLVDPHALDIKFVPNTSDDILLRCFNDTTTITTSIYAVYGINPGTGALDEPADYAMNGVDIGYYDETGLYVDYTTPSLHSGNYQFQLTNSNGCEFFLNKTVVQPNPMTMEISSTNDPLCNNLTTGKIDVDIAGGIPASTLAYGDPDFPPTPNANYYVIELYNSASTTTPISAITTYTPGIYSFEDLIGDSYEVRLRDVWHEDPSGFIHPCPISIDVELPNPDTIGLYESYHTTGETTVVGFGGSDEGDYVFAAVKETFPSYYAPPTSWQLSGSFTSLTSGSNYKVWVKKNVTSHIGTCGANEIIMIE